MPSFLFYFSPSLLLSLIFLLTFFLSRSVNHLLNCFFVFITLLVLLVGVYLCHPWSVAHVKQASLFSFVPFTTCLSAWMYFAVPGIHYQWRFVLYSRRCCLLVCSSVVCWGKQVMLSSFVTFCQFVCLSLYLSLSSCHSFRLSVSVCWPLSASQFSFCLSVSQYLSLSVCLSVCLFVDLSASQFCLSSLSAWIWLSAVCQPVC